MVWKCLCTHANQAVTNNEVVNRMNYELFLADCESEAELSETVSYVNYPGTL